MAATRETVKRLLVALSEQSCQCPAHSHSFSRLSTSRPESRYSKLAGNQEYAFELATSTVRYGHGVTQEVGLDLANMKSKLVGVFTDENLQKLPVMSKVINSLTANGINYSIYSGIEIEPTEESLKKAISFASQKTFDAFLAVGGGSVMDTAKAANLYSCHPENDFLDFVNVPIGKGLPVVNPLKPLICVPTTAGTGSETTGVVIFDYKPLKAKTGIGNRALRPTLGLIDPEHVTTMPKNVAVFSGFDVLCHALESYTAVPFNERGEAPSNPIFRPAYQGSNPISDIWSKEALKTIQQYFLRSVNDSDDIEARGAMHLASMCAGIGFGNAGPHGLSVVISAPAVFEFTAPLCPERHLEAAALLGMDTTNSKLEDAGRILAEAIRNYMYKTGIPNGLTALGYSSEDIPNLVRGTLPQHRVTKLSPRAFTEDQLSILFEKSMTVY
uniref:hydroxyacid-oxoacid transhydrogenase n=1 Tax=Amphimedon queenslandica TaxID=400682 RepID=A0A1X7VIK2_AMPQE